jgi:hypothetical protein
MFRRKPTLISIVGEERLNFLMLLKDGRSKTLTSLDLEAFVGEDAEPVDLPAAVSHSTNELLIVPDYWVGNDFQAFQARKRSVVTAYIERKLKKEHPALNEIGDFYGYEIVSDQNDTRRLYTFYFQETVSYDLYRRLKDLGAGPLRITTPAMIWQTRLKDIAGPLANESLGLIHLEEADCFLYFFYMGRFLFSRHIQLPAGGSDHADVDSLLNYEINQSFYLYSQKTKRPVDALFMTGADETAAERLSQLMDRTIRQAPRLLPEGFGMDKDAVPPSCRGFSSLDLTHPGGHHIAHKPLQIERAWRPVQWTGIAVGLLLAVLVVSGAGYLHILSGSVDRQMGHLASTMDEQPDQLLEEISLSLDEITRDLARPSGSGTIMRTILARPEGVQMRKILLQVAAAPYLVLEAAIGADHPEAFKVLLNRFLDQLNQRFDLKDRPLREKDVEIQLERGEGNEKKPVYTIRLGFQIS